jgi:hypothetical protein
MAQLAQGDIKVGMTRTVGRIRVDPGTIRSEGGPMEPRLTIPAIVEMNNRPNEQMLALARLTAYLHMQDPNNPNTQVGSPAQVDLLPGMHARSLPEGHNEYNVDLRFQLSFASVQRLESMRHQMPDEQFTLHLRMNGSVVWIRETFGEMHPSGGRAGAAAPDDPFKMQYGLHSALSYFWTTDIDSMRVDPSVWIGNVLPGFGIDGIRLLELAFPPALPKAGNAANVFDEALRAFNSKHYKDCIGKCRAIVSAWNTQFGATDKKHLADLVAPPKAGRKTIHARTRSTRFGRTHHRQQCGASHRVTASWIRTKRSRRAPAPPFNGGCF